MAEFLVEGINGNLSLDSEQPIDPRLYFFFCLLEFRSIRVRLRLEEFIGEIVRQRDRQDEITIGKTLHESRRAEAIAAMVGKVGFSDRVQTGDRGLEIVVHPDAAHRIVDGRIDHHRLFPRTYVSDLEIHIKEIAVTLLHPLTAQTLDGVREIQKYRQTVFVYAETGVATLFGSSGSHVARNQIAECGIATFEIVIPILFRNLGCLDFALAQLHYILRLLRHPDTAIVAQRFGHERQLALLLSMNRNAGRVNLREAGVAEIGPSPVTLHRCGTVTIHRIGRKEISVSVAACRNDNRMSAETLQLTGNQIPGDNSLCLTVNHHKIQHLVTRVTDHGSGRNLTIERGIGSKQELLAGLSPSIESTAHLDAAERTVVKITAIFPGERNALRDTLVDNGTADFRKAIDIGLSAAIVAPFDRVVEKTIDGVVVILVILRSVDSSLRGDGMRPTGRITDAENLYIVSQFSKRGRCGSSSQAGAHNDDLKFSSVVRIDKTKLGFAFGPLFSQRSVRNLRD